VRMHVTANFSKLSSYSPKSKQADTQWDSNPLMSNPIPNPNLKVTFLTYFPNLHGKSPPGGGGTYTYPGSQKLERVLQVLLNFGTLCPSQPCSYRLLDSIRTNTPTIVNPKFPVNRSHVPANRVSSDEQGLGNLSVRMACCQER